MCVIEQRTYIQPNGDRRIVEKARRCKYAQGDRTCSRVEHKTIESTRLAEIRTSSSRRTATKQEWSTMPSSKKPRAPTPPPPSRQPSYPPTLPPLPSTMFTADGTAIYDRPPSLNMPRVTDNERRRRSSVSSTAAEVDDIEPHRTRRRPSMSIKTSFRRSADHLGTPSPTTSSPGLSNLPPLSALKHERHDSANIVPQRDIRYETMTDEEVLARLSSQDNAQNRRLARDAQQRQQELAVEDRIREDQRQARLDTDRYRTREQLREETAAAHRASLAREDASRERHRQHAAAALESTTASTSLAARIEAEDRQLDREAAQAAARRSQSEEQPQRRLAPLGAGVRAHSYNGEAPDYRPSKLRYDSSSPVSVARTSYGQPAVHYYSSPTGSSSRRPSDSIRDQGRNVIAREQARAAAAELQAVVGESDGALVEGYGLEELRFEERRPRLGDVVDDYPTSRDAYEVVRENVDVRYNVSDGLARRESRLRRRDDDRERRKADFWR